MLILRRKSGQSFWVGEDVEVEIVELSQTKVKLAIRAPHDVPVIRGEARMARIQNLHAAKRISGQDLVALTSRLRTEFILPQTPSLPTDKRLETISHASDKP